MSQKNLALPVVKLNSAMFHGHLTLNARLIISIMHQSSAAQKMILCINGWMVDWLISCMNWLTGGVGSIQSAVSGTVGGLATRAAPAGSARASVTVASQCSSRWNSHSSVILVAHLWYRRRSILIIAPHGRHFDGVYCQYCQSVEITNWVRQ